MILYHGRVLSLVEVHPPTWASANDLFVLHFSATRLGQYRMAVLDQSYSPASRACQYFWGSFQSR